MSITYTACLPVRDETVLRVAALLYAERLRRATRSGRRALTCQQQAVFFLRWCWTAPGLANWSTTTTSAPPPATTGCTRTPRSWRPGPGLHAALLAAKAAGYDYVLLDGTLIETDRGLGPRPETRRRSVVVGKVQNHGGNIQVLCAPDGWPLWTSPIRPGRGTRHHPSAHPPRPARHPPRHPR